MLTELDHFVLLTRDFLSDVQDYKILLGFEPDEYANRHGFQIALFRTGNSDLEIMAPQSEVALSRTEDILGKTPSKLTSLVFAAPNLAEAHKILGRRGGKPSELSTSFRLSDTVCAGVKTFIVPVSAVSAYGTDLCLGYERLCSPLWLILSDSFADLFG